MPETEDFCVEEMMNTMKPIEELKQIFLQERINYWKSLRQDRRVTVREVVNELDLIQVIVGKAP